MTKIPPKQINVRFFSLSWFFAIILTTFAHKIDQNAQFMSITVSKTRDVLVDVARQLFARMGVDHTTMNDIAQA
ncbi:MAG: TetR family transcriptional regulator, partial [Tannerella sp.]|nr:TetR family transcriptional regulator [Tannerella sp.]